MQIISINGRDGVGKSEQVGLLKADLRFHLAGSLVDYSDRWTKLNPVDSFNWWFRDLSFRDLVSIILESLKARRASLRSDRINVNDRGSHMFKAVCAATLVTREQVSDERAMNVVNNLFEEELHECQNEHELMLVPNIAYSTTMKPILSLLGPRDGKYLPWQSEMYAKYQVSLARFMGLYCTDIIDPANVICVDSCILDTHTKLQTIIGRICGIGCEPICDTLEKLIAFGGLSECGKSSFAEQLSIAHHFCRLKIKYFGENLQNRGLEVKPALLGKEILGFLHNHRHITRASVESLHGPDLPAYLKLLFGPRLKIVYLNTPEHIRVKRTANTLGIDLKLAKANTVAKDRVKLSRGADKVKGIADIVFDNSVNDFNTAFQAFVSQI